jgi:hypothetical protein
VLVAALALLVDLGIGLIGHFVVSPGLTRRRVRTSSTQPVPVTPAAA